jgi:hypothetical protein
VVGRELQFAYESGLTALGEALANYSKARAGIRAGEMGFPSFKKAGTRRSCRFWAGVSLIDARHIRLPRIGVVRSKEMTTSLLCQIDDATARILNATISEEVVARTHRRVRTCRADALHQLSARLASTYGAVVLEDLHVAGMTRSPKPVRESDGSFARNGKRSKAGLNRAILDVAPGELRRQITDELTWHGGKLVVADRYFPSSKLCSSCGAVKAKLSLAERT